MTRDTVPEARTSKPEGLDYLLEESCCTKKFYFSNRMIQLSRSS